MFWRKWGEAAKAGLRALEGSGGVRGIAIAPERLVLDSAAHPVLALVKTSSDWDPAKTEREAYIKESIEQLQAWLRESFPDSKKLLILKVNQTVLDSEAKHRPYPGHIATCVLDISGADLKIAAGTLMSKAGYDSSGGLTRRTVESVSIGDGRVATVPNYQVAARFDSEEDFLRGSGLIDTGPETGSFLKQASKEYIVAIPMESLADIPVSRLFGIWEACGIIPKDAPSPTLSRILEEGGVHVPEDAASVSYEDFMRVSVHLVQNGIKNEDGSYLIQPRAVYDLLNDACTQAVGAVHGVKISAKTSTQLTAVEVLGQIGRKDEDYSVRQTISDAVKKNLGVTAFDLGKMLRTEKGKAPPSSAAEPDGPVP